MSEPTLHRVAFVLCPECLDGESGMCHTPGCALNGVRCPDFSMCGDMSSIDGALFCQMLKQLENEAYVETDEALYKSAIEVFGADSRMRLIQEECAELIAAVAQFARGRVGVLELAEELADVEIMCGQLRLLVGPGAVEAAKRAKLERLTDRVQGGCDV